MGETFNQAVQAIVKHDADFKFKELSEDQYNLMSKYFLEITDAKMSPVLVNGFNDEIKKQIKNNKHKTELKLSINYDYVCDQALAPYIAKVNKEVLLQDKNKVKLIEDMKFFVKSVGLSCLTKIPKIVSKPIRAYYKEKVKKNVRVQLNISFESQIVTISEKKINA